MYKYTVETGHWKIDDFLKIEDHLLQDDLSLLGDQVEMDCSNVILVSTFDQQSLIALLQKTENRKEHLYLTQFRDSRWEQQRNYRKLSCPTKQPEYPMP